MSKELRGRRSESKQPSVNNPGASSSSMSNSAGNAIYSTASSQHSAPQKATKSSRNNCPHHKANPATDVTRQVRVCSSKKNEWVEVNAVFAADLDKLNQNWISEDLVQRLQLTRTFNSGDEAEYGRLEKTFQFRGSLTLRWAEKGGHKSTFTSCRIAPILEKCVFDVDLTPAPPLSSPSLEETHLSTASTSTISSVGSFHTEPKVIEENSETAISADNWISAFKRSVHKSIDKEEGYSSIALPVKIAVLDTGLDVKHPGIMTAMQMGQIQRVMRSFVENDKSLQDDCGHGTHIASLISDIAPQAQIYIAKVAGKQEISPNHNIAGAIQWATDELQVDIITMSFGLEKYDQDVQDAILRACSKNIIMFSAASNQGGNSGVKYPANRDEVICIYSTDGMGNPSHFNPTKMDSEGYHFAILGEGIKSAWPKKLAPSSAPEQLGQRMSGTSFAAPIAAGTAACILEFALKNDMKKSHGDLYRVLRSRQGIHTVFKKLLATERKEYHYIHPSKLFDVGGRTTDPNRYIFEQIVDSMDV